MKRNWLVAFGTLAVLVPLGICAVGKQVNADYNEDGSVTIDEANFPDEGFRTFISKETDKNKDGILSKEELKSVTELEIPIDSSISDIQGIGFFPELEMLVCNDLGLTKLDVRNNTNLYSLSCSGNQLEELDVSQNSELGALDCSNNRLSELDVNQNDQLFVLQCQKNNLTQLDLSSCGSFPEKLIHWSTCRLEDGYLSFSFDISQLVWCSDGYYYLSVEEASDTLSIDTTTELFFTDKMEGPEAVEIDAESFPDEQFRLFVKDYDLNQDGVLSKFELYFVREIELSKRNIQSLKGVENFINLRKLVCSENALTSLDISQNENLEYVDCRHNLLTELKLSKNVGQLFCYGNEIQVLDVSPSLVFQSWFQSFKTSYEDEDETIIRLSKQYSSSAGTVEPLYKLGYVGHGYYYLYFDSTTVIVNSNREVPSSDGVGGFIQRLYRVALNREFDQDGLEYWVEEVESGSKTGADCAYFFLIDSPEFLNRGLKTEDFVETLYKTFFERDSEPAGKAYWVDELKNTRKSRADVIRGFIDSAEWCNICAEYGVKSGAPTAKANKATDEVKSFAIRLYSCCLNRGPESDGLKYWGLALTNHEKSGYEAAHFFFTSDEFKNLKTSNEEYITRLYTTFMDREPETDGFNYWVGELKKGKSRDDVLISFAQSEEFTNICNEYGIERGAI